MRRRLYLVLALVAITFGANGSNIGKNVPTSGEVRDHLPVNLPGSLKIGKPDLDSLRQVLIVHRHGDRTPESFPPRDTLRKEPFWYFHGIGQLTNRGKARMYLLGKLVRQRYNDFMGKSVNKNLRTSSSAATMRCLESADTFLASFLNLNLPESPDAGRLVWDVKSINPIAGYWQPASVSSVPPSLDGVLEAEQCNALRNEYDHVINDSPEGRYIREEYRPESLLINETLGYGIHFYYDYATIKSLIEIETTYFPNKVAPKLVAAYGRIAEAGDLAYAADRSTVRALRLKGGMLINDILNHMLQRRADSQQNQPPTSAQQLPSPHSSKRFVHYSTHDTNIAPLLGILNNWKRFPYSPDFSSSLIIELHQRDGEWFVRLFYLPVVPGQLHELHLSACEAGHPRALCTLDRFEEVVEPYRVSSWQQWMRECGNDFTNVDPYAQPGSP